MKEDITEFIVVFIGFWIGIALFVGAVKLRANSDEKDFMIEISSYETISINGADYNTDEVTSIISHPKAHKEDVYEVTFKDGTKVHFSASSYTLKDKK